MTLDEMPVWDGKLENLPKYYVRFLYKGSVWEIQECDCQCGRPSAYKVEQGRIADEEDHGMTLRIRGANTGMPLWDVLIKAGAMTSDELVDTFTTRGSFRPFLAKFDEILVKKGAFHDPMNFLGTVEVTPIQYRAFVQYRTMVS